MREKVQSVYTCDFCKKKLLVKHAMQRHEDLCNNNPKNFAACSGCIYIKEVPKEYSAPNNYDHDSDGVINTKGFRCTKLDKGLYPFLCVRKNMLKKYPEQFEGEEQMPAECEHRKDFDMDFDIFND